MKPYHIREKERQVAYSHEYYLQHRETILERARLRPRSTQYAQEHREELALYRKAYRQTNLEKEQRRAKAYYQKYYQVHKERLRDEQRAWLKANPGKSLEYYNRHRARKLCAPIVDFSSEQWDYLKAVFTNSCAYCGLQTNRLAQDHVIPVSKGGAHTLANILPACQPCNSKKGTGPPLPFIRPLFVLSIRFRLWRETRN
jgi:5-methylcytosine-specific restriction endonuclease McrA